jgi:hypothetical protein
MSVFVDTFSGTAVVSSGWSPATSDALDTQYVFTQGWSMGGSTTAVSLIGIEWVASGGKWVPRITLNSTASSSVTFTLYYYYQ